MHFRRFRSLRFPDNRDHAMLDFPPIDGAKPAIVHAQDVHVAPTAYLPFRRISLPSAPNLQRQSIVLRFCKTAHMQ